MGKFPVKCIICGETGRINDSEDSSIQSWTQLKAGWVCGACIEDRENFA